MHKEAALESLRTNPTDDQEEASMDARIGHRVLAQDATTSPCLAPFLGHAFPPLLVSRPSVRP